jgi:hypothetical protein
MFRRDKSIDTGSRLAVVWDCGEGRKRVTIMDMD